MYGKMKEHLSNTLAEIKEAGLYKEERLIESAQQAAITVKGKEVLNFCANNYLGLSNHPRLIAAAQKMMDHRGYGMSSVRFICGTQDIHKELEAAISDYFKTEDTILYACLLYTSPSPPYYMLLVLMLTVVYSSRYLRKKTPSSPIL